MRSITGNESKLNYVWLMADISLKVQKIHTSYKDNKKPVAEGYMVMGKGLEKGHLMIRRRRNLLLLVSNSSYLQGRYHLQYDFHWFKIITSLLSSL